MGSWSNIYHYQEFQSNIKESKILRLGNNNYGEQHLDSDSPKNTTNDGSGGGKITGQKVSWLIKTSERFANQNQFMTFRVPVLTLDFYFIPRSKKKSSSLCCEPSQVTSSMDGSWGAQFYGREELWLRLWLFVFRLASNLTISNFLQIAHNGTHALNGIHKY